MNYDMLETLQADVFAVLSNSPALADAHIILDSAGDLESRVTKALGLQAKGNSNKRGLVVIVLLPDAESSDSNLPGPPLEMKVEIQTIEHAQTNRGSGGTGIRSSQAALRVLSALHHQGLGPHILYSSKKPIEVLPAIEGLVSHAVTLYVRATGLNPPDKVLSVSASMSEGGTLTLTNNTSGAAIRYSTDGTYPTPANGLRYTAPLTGLAAGTILRAVAYKATMQPSDLTELLITE